MKAERAARNPAMRSSSDVLPAPDGPKMAVTCRCISTSTSSVKSASGSEIFFSSRLMSLFFSAQEKFTAPHGGEGQDDRYAQQAEGPRVVAELHVLENGERERRGLARNVAGDHDRRAKFAERAGEGEQHAADDAPRGQREGDGKKHAQAAGAKGAGDLLQARIDFFKRHAGGADRQRHRHDAQGQQHGAPGKDDIQMELVVEEAAQ